MGLSTVGAAGARRLAAANACSDREHVTNLRCGCVILWSTTSFSFLDKVSYLDYPMKPKLNNLDIR